jgi:mRNA interferase MazF
MRDSEVGRLDAFDIVIVPFPYSDRLAEKRRPGVIVSNRKLHALGVVWIVMVTSADNPGWPGDVPIADLKRSGLPAPSIIRPAKIASIDPARILRKAGRLDKATARIVSQRVRGSIG